MKVLFKTEDGVDKHVGDAYYCVQNGTKGNHHHPFKVQLVKMENKPKVLLKKSLIVYYLLMTQVLKDFT